MAKLRIDKFLGNNEFTDHPGTFLDAINIRIKGDKAYTIPNPEVLYDNITSDLGMYVWGKGDATVIVCFGVSDKAYDGTWFNSLHSEVPIYTAIDYRNDSIIQVDLSQYGVPNDRAIPAVVVGDDLWFTAGGQLYKASFLPESYDTPPSAPACYPEIQAMTLGYEAGTASYLTEAVDARIMTIHNGRVFYAGVSPKSHGVTSAVDPTDIPALAALARDPDGRWQYRPNQVVFSEPYQPNAIKVWGFIGIEDYQAKVTGLVSWNHALYIFTRSGVWQYSGDDPLTATLERVPGVPGCVEHNTIQVVGNTLFWLSPTGIHYMSPKGHGQVKGLDQYFNINPIVLEWFPSNPQTSGFRYDSAASTTYGYYLLTLTDSDIAVVDISSFHATIFLFHASFLNGEIRSLVGIGDAGIGGQYSDVLIGTKSKLLAHLWDGGSGENSFLLALPSTGERHTWRRVDIELFDAGRIDTAYMSILEYSDFLVHALDIPSSMTDAQPEGWESMAMLDSATNPFILGTGSSDSSNMEAGHWRIYSSRFNQRAAQPVAYVYLATTRTTMINSITFYGGPDRVGDGDA